MRVGLTVPADPCIESSTFDILTEGRILTGFAASLVGKCRPSLIDGSMYGVSGSVNGFHCKFLLSMQLCRKVATRGRDYCGKREPAPRVDPLPIARPQQCRWSAVVRVFSYLTRAREERDIRATEYIKLQ